MAEIDRITVERIKCGDAAAFDVFFERYRRGLLAYVRGMTGDLAGSEDIVQEVFIEFVRRIDRIDAGKGVAAWLFRVARNRAIDFMRRRRKETVTEPGPMAEMVSGGATAGPDEAVMKKEEGARVEMMLGKLDGRLREVLLLRFDAGLSFRETAETLGRPIGTVLWQAREGLSRLRKMMESVK